MRRFVREAVLFSDGEDLARACVGALSRFTDGALAAVYERTESGAFAKIGGGFDAAPDLLDGADPVLERPRAEPKPTELIGGDLRLGATLAAPMVTRSQVVGLGCSAASRRTWTSAPTRSS